MKRGTRYPIETLTHQEVKRLLSVCSNRAASGVRNRALIVLLWRSGLRISEALALYPRDIDKVRGSLRVRHGKGDKDRIVGMDSTAFDELEKWEVLRTRRGLTDAQPVFCTLQGKPMMTAYIRTLLPRLARKAGITKRVHAHGLRHTMACELAAEGVPIVQIQKQLGHAEPALTFRYLDHIAPEHVLRTMRSRQW